MNSSPWQHRFWRALYDRAAFAYDAVLRAGAWLRLGSEERIRHKVIGNLALPAGVRVLEIGCGTASNRLYLPGNIRYIGLDISRGMLARAQRNCAKVKPHADFVQADAAALPFSATVAHLVLAMGTLQHVSHIGRAIREMNRLCSPSGSLLIIDERRSQARIIEGATSGNDKREIFGEYFVLHFQKT